MTPTPPHPRLAARARRVARLRGRVAAAALATFALAWGVIAFHGSLGAETPAASAQGTTTSSDSGTSTTQSDTPSAVTTQQS